MKGTNFISSFLLSFACCIEMIKRDMRTAWKASTVLFYSSWSQCINCEGLGQEAVNLNSHIQLKIKKKTLTYIFINFMVNYQDKVIVSIKLFYSLKIYYWIIDEIQYQFFVKTNKKFIKFTTKQLLLDANLKT